jgi:hypothetical protein
MMLEKENEFGLYKVKPARHGKQQVEPFVVSDRQ